MEELNNDSSFISHRSTTEPRGTGPKTISIHQAALLSSLVAYVSLGVMHSYSFIFCCCCCFLAFVYVTASTAGVAKAWPSCFLFIAVKKAVKSKRTPGVMPEPRGKDKI